MVRSSEAKDWARANLRGLWGCPLAAFHADYSVDEEGDRRNIEHCLAMDVGGVGYTVLMEPWSSTHKERMRGVEVMVDQVAGRVPIYVNVTDHSAAETVQLANHAAHAGADLVLLNCPYEWAKSDDLVYGFYAYVTERTDVGIILYNTPHSGFKLSPELIDRLADLEPMCGLKNAYDDFENTREAVRLAGDRIVVSEALERNFLRALLETGQQTLLATTATHLMQTPTWQPIREYMLAAQAGQLDRARRVFDDIQPLRDVWNQIYSPLFDVEHALHPFGLGKYWQELIGMAGGPVRPPMPGATDSEKAWLRGEIAASGLAERLKIQLEQPTSSAL